MLQCIHILISFINEESLECLSKLLSTIGELIEQTENLSDQFAAIDNLIENYKTLKISNRIRFMLQDLRDLRKNNWQTRRKATVNPQKLDNIKIENNENGLDDSSKVNSNNCFETDNDINLRNNFNTSMHKTLESNGFPQRKISNTDKTPLRKISTIESAPLRKISTIENAPLRKISANETIPLRKISNVENNMPYRKNSRVEHGNNSRMNKSSLQQNEQTLNSIDSEQKKLNQSGAGNTEPQDEWSTSSKKKSRQQNGNKIGRNPSKAMVCEK